MDPGERAKQRERERERWGTLVIFILQTTTPGRRKTIVDNFLSFFLRLSEADGLLLY